VPVTPNPISPLSSNASQNAIEIGKDVIIAEQAGLESLQNEIDVSFSNAVDLILKAKNYVIVVGVGKSGHIGQKIAASFASTGTPSFFMHPTEASHGDLGMVTDDSVILAISNSGESRELRDVLRYARRNQIPVIGITAKPESALGRNSKFILKLPASREACPNGLAPTTSTTNTLALGDALVLATSALRGFSSEDFGQRHPGGKIGLQLQTVEDWLFSHVNPFKTVPVYAGMDAVIMAISEGRSGCVAVVDDLGHMLGIITDGDVRRAIAEDFFEKTAGDIMTASPQNLHKSMRMSEVISMFSKKLKRASCAVSTTPLMIKGLRDSGLMTRPLQPNQSTEFSFSRFLVPYLMNYQGWALFVDNDVVMLEDIAELWALRDDDFAVMCVKHNHVPEEGTKFLGEAQTQYEKKNWSSVMLINCSKCTALTPDYVNSASGLELHRFH